MLYYTEVDLSSYEIPGETTLNIYISGCQNRCIDCHYPELQSNEYGEPLNLNFKRIIELYSNYATCICFMGEGRGTTVERNEMQDYIEHIHLASMKAALYCGRDTTIESWMEDFDYVKVGRFYPDKGPLTAPTTNQKMYMKENSEWINITYSFYY